METPKGSYVYVDLTKDIQNKIDAVETIREKRRVAFMHIMDNLRGKYPASDGRIVEINRRSANELTFKAPEIRLHVTPELESIIRAGQFKEIKPAEHGGFKDFAYYEVVLKVGDDYYSALVNIGIMPNGDSVLYQINKFEENDTPTQHWRDQKFVAAEGDAVPLNNNIGDFPKNVNSKN